MLAACAPQGERSSSTREPLEVEDVSMPVDVALSTEQDVKGPPIIQGVSGVLPGDYPRDLPTHEPSSVSDYGPRPEGGSFVELESPSAKAAVVSSMTERLQRGGWQLTVTGNGRLKAVKGAATVSFEITELYSGSRIRIEY